LKRIRDTIEEVKGAKESKPMEGKLGGVVTLYLEAGKRVAAAKEA